MIRNNDKRRARRDKHDSVIELFDGNGRLKGHGRLADHSSTGISFASEETFAKGDKVSARLRLLHLGVLDVAGEIVWARKEGGRALYGVRFSSVRQVHPTGEFKGER